MRKDLFWVFMSLEKAHEKVGRDALRQVMRLFGVGGKLLEEVQSFNVNNNVCVRIGNEVREWFSVNVMVRQGCVMSPLLFNFYMDGDSVRSAVKNTWKRCTVGK